MTRCLILIDKSGNVKLGTDTFALVTKFSNNVYETSILKESIFSSEETMIFELKLLSHSYMT